MSKYLDNKSKPPENQQSENNEEIKTHKLYYKNQYSDSYKTDERILQAIIQNNVKCVNNKDNLKLIIYYQSATSKSLVMRNNQAPMTPPMQQTNLIYEYNCVQDDCEHLPKSSYIGLTTTTLSRRITMHLSSGGPKNHNLAAHKETPISRDLMVENTRILRRENDNRRLQIYESLLIQQKYPEINNQITGSARTLKLFCSSNPIPTQSRNLPRNNKPHQNRISQHNNHSNRSRVAQNNQSNQNNVSQNINQPNQNNITQNHIQPIQNISSQNNNQSNQNNVSQNNSQNIQNNISQTNNNQAIGIQLTQNLPLSPIPTCQIPIASLSQPTQSNYQNNRPVSRKLSSQPVPTAKTALRRSVRVRNRPS